MSGHQRTARELKPVGGLPRYVYNAMNSGRRHGCDYVPLQHAPAYKKVQHMLDEFGVVKRECKVQHSSELRKALTEIRRKQEGPIPRLLLNRLLNHLNKNRHRHDLEVEGTAGRNRDTDQRCYKRFGFTMSELMQHVELLFLPGMSWERVAAGDIQLDHEIPVRCFDLSTAEGIKRAYALSNTRPLWRGDNARKGRTKDLGWLQLFGEGSIK